MNAPAAAAPKADMTHVQWLSLAVLLLVALAVRLYRIETESIWFDESVTYLSLDRATALGYFRAEAGNDPLAVPVYFGSAYLWYNLGFTSVVGMRMLSVIAGMLNVALMYVFGRRLFGHIGGMTAALCMSLAKLQIYMSQEVRNYAFTLLLACFAMYALNEAVRTNRRRWWVINVVTNGLLCLTHYLAVVLLFAEGLYLLALQPRKFWRNALWTMGHAPFLLFVPVWVHMVATESIDGAASWITWQPVSRAFKAYYFVFAGSLQDAMDFVRIRPFGIPVEHLLGTGLMAAGMAYVGYCAWTCYARRDGRLGYSAPSALLLLVWLFVPPATLFIAARLIRPCFIERYVLYSALALFLIVGGAIAALPRTRWQYAAFGLLAAIYAGNLVDYPRPLRHDYISTGAVLRDEYAPGERVYVCFDNTVLPMKYYAGVPKDAIIGEENFVTPAIADASNGKHAWMWFVDVPARWEHEQIEAQMTQHGVSYRKWEFAGRWRTFLYRLEPIK